VILKLNSKGDHWTVRNAVEGLQIFGKPGSGKTSGSGRTFALSVLGKGYGGLILCAKAGECNTWLQYAKETDQLDRIVVFSSPERLAIHQKNFPGLHVSVDKFNPFTYENERDKGEGGGTTQAIVNMFSQSVEMADRISTGKSGAKPDFWEKNMRLLLTHTVALLKLADEKGGPDDFSLKVRNINQFINGAPKGVEDIDPASYIGRVFEAAEARVNDLEKTYEENKNVETIANYNPYEDEFESAENIFEDARSYFESQYFPMAEKQRSGIESTWNGFAGYFTGDGILAKRFSGEISDRLRPSVTFEGEQPQVIILDFPEKLFGINGLLAQGLYKMVWQSSVEGRSREQVKHALPCFLYIDEAQFFLSQRDQAFLTTAREAKCITCLITQSKANYDEKLGPQLSNALLNLLGSVLFHWQNNAETNAWAVKVIAQEKGLSESKTLSGEGVPSRTYREEIRNQIEPYEFLNLQPDLEKMYTYGIFYQSGRTWSNGKRYLEVTFDMLSGKRERKRPIKSYIKTSHLWLSTFFQAWAERIMRRA